MYSLGSRRPSRVQVETLVDFLERHPGIARGLIRTNHGKLETKRKWSSLAPRLNALGGATKDGRGWAKYWAERKCTLKKIYSQHAESMGQAGDDPSDRLSDLDKRLIVAMGLQELTGGDKHPLVDPFLQTSQEAEMSDESTTRDEEDVFVMDSVKQESKTSSSIIAGPSRIKRDSPIRNSISEAQTRPIRGNIQQQHHQRSITPENPYDMKRLAAIEERHVNAEMITARALADVAAAMDRNAAAVENVANGISSIANAVLEIAKALRQQ